MHKFEATQNPARLAVVIVAGGAGTRAGGDIPKQFQRFGGRRLLAWSVDVCAASPQVDVVVVVAPEDRVGALRSDYQSDERMVVVAGGEDRTASVRAGLAALAELAPDYVLIHDAARPGLTEAMIASLVAALQHSDAAAPALPMVDAVKRVDGDRVHSVDREGLVRVQTPQAFRYPVIAAAYAQASGGAVDDLAMIETNARIRLVDGAAGLMKVTHAGDMALAARLLVTQDIRIGSGYDVHAFAPGDHVTLCGVEIPHERRLAGHSDADAGWHALTDAILGAVALGDIGDHFPPGDAQWKGAESRIFLIRAVELAAELGYRVNNADITLICEAPKIGPHRAAMRTATASVLGVELGRVSVKATTTERLGFTGRGEGIAAQASVTLVGGA